MLTDEILMCLDDVKPAGRGKWTSCCPNKQHRHARVSIRDAGDRSLIHCWGGCGTGDVIGASGLSFSDLYHEELTAEKREEKKEKFSYESLQHERLIIQIASRSTHLSMDDKERVKLAKYRLRVSGWLSPSTALQQRDRRRLSWLS